MRFNTKPSVFLSGDTVVISFSLSWDHSWRDDFNWDAIWVFGKYTVGMEDTWHHLKLLPSGHSAPSGFTYDVGNIDASHAGGIFLMLSEKGGMNVNNQRFTIKTLRSNIGGITDADIANNDVFLSLAAMEMVYIPYGGYYLGDGATANRLGNNVGEPIAVTGEDAFTVYSIENGAPTTYKSLSANFPKGYKGFYCMKYEVSQEQYVSFLNNLTRTQQKERIGNNLDELKVGEYVFGDKSRPNYRNGICVLANSSDAPAVFGCNLNPAEPYFGEDDGSGIACNYLTPADMLAYCDWTCLRPMSELEFEKACRMPYPQPAVAGEFVWNSASGVNGLDTKSGLLNAGKVSEKPSSLITNVNYDNPDFGPVRSASFGTSNSTQTQAGATFWGLMEMSGNVAELCYSVDAG
ncbi:MAG: SUMF1/EgtB/PvdO family nonheme iron enzyme, partial [Culturomica sp.]|nr:SUMF1/EgtB/PvdO family nonheme iron enzyme [Culturomica sp.]